MRILSEIILVISVLAIVILSITNGPIRSMILQLAVIIISLFSLEDSK